MALTINAKKNRLYKKDFDKLGDNLGISEKAREKVYQNFEDKFDSVKGLINQSFLNQSLSDIFLHLITERLQRLD